MEKKTRDAHTKEIGVAQQRWEKEGRRQREVEAATRKIVRVKPHLPPEDTETRNSHSEAQEFVCCQANKLSIQKSPLELIFDFF